MQDLYLIILKYQWDKSKREKTEVNNSQQTILKLAYRDLSSMRKHELTWIFITRNDAIATNLFAGLSQGF